MYTNTQVKTLRSSTQRKDKMLLLGFITALCSASFIEKRSDDGGRPGQVHLAYYNETVRSVSWITFENVTQYLYVKEVSDKKLKVSSQK